MSAQSNYGGTNYQIQTGPHNTNFVGGTHIHQGQPNAYGTPNNVPRSGVVQFVGREADLTQLQAQLDTENSVAISAIAGMGGIGKTELALQYAQDSLQAGTYPDGICWLRVRDREEVGSQLVAYGQAQLGLMLPEGLELKDQVAYCWRHWPSTEPTAPGKVLVVYDDVTHYSQLQPYLPPVEGRFRVLMTTRLRLGPEVRSFEIRVLSAAAALALLTALAGAARIAAELAAATAVCDWLGYLPLGIELAGRYLARKPELSLATLQERLNAKGIEARALLKAAQSEDLQGMTAKRSVAAAFELSWQDLSADAQRLACGLSLFALAPFPWEWVQPCFPETDEEDLEDWRDRLVSLHLIGWEATTQTYQLHQLIREFLWVKLKAHAEALVLQQAYCQIMASLAQQMPQTPTRAQVLDFALLQPHLAEAATRWPAALPAEDETALWPFVALARYYEGQGSYAEASPWYEACLAFSQARFGDEHPAVATSLNNLAELYRLQGRYSEAEPLYQQALAMRQKLLGAAHPDVASSLNNLAALYASQGRYGEAEPLYQQALAMRQKLLGAAHPDVASSLNNLALLYKSQGRYSEAEPLYLQALMVFMQRLGEDHPYTQTTINNFVGFLQQVLTAGQTEVLSDHPWTQARLQQLQSPPEPS